MFYVARGSIPPPAPHPAPGARRQPVRRGAVRRRGVHRAQLAPVPPAPPTRTHKVEPMRDVVARGRRRRLPPPPPDRHGRARAARRRDHRAHPAVLQHRRRDGRGPAGRGDAGRTPSTATAKRTRCCSSTRAPASAETNFGPTALRPGRLPRPADRHDVAPRSRRGRRPADAVPRVPVGDRAAEALPQRLRPAARALAVLAARHPRPRRGPGPHRRDGEFVVHVRSRGRLTAYHYRHHPFDVVGWDGYLWPLRVQHRRLPADHRAASTSRRRSTRRSRRATSSCARSCPASSTTTRSRSRRRTTTRTSTATRSSTTSPATS